MKGHLGLMELSRLTFDCCRCWLGQVDTEKEGAGEVEEERNFVVGEGGIDHFSTSNTSCLLLVGSS